MSLFELGAVLMTAEVSRMVEEDGAIGTVLDCLQRHASGDWEVRPRRDINIARCGTGLQPKSSYPSV